MNIAEKPDANLFRQHLATLRKAEWLGRQKEWWTQFLFHFANIHNIVSILKAGELLSRQAASTQEEFHDSASPEIIHRTEDKWKNYVRFYLRPRTPTLYRNEGFRPLSRLELGGAHCPVPIYLLFSFEKIVCRNDSQFSFGSLARTNTPTYQNITDFRRMPFERIYHDEAFKREERDTIVFHRHAEVIVPNRVDLSQLEFIWCRSQAEYETLRYLLPDPVWSKWRNKIIARKDHNVFHRRWIYVEQATLGSREIRFSFNLCKDNQDRGPFNIQVEIIETLTGTAYRWQDLNYMIATDKLVIELSNLKAPDDYTVSLKLDGNLAYQSRYQEYDAPF